jgi:hypothetical protein
LEELRQYVRRAGKFLPEKIDMVKYEGHTARESKQLFYDFRRDTDRARLAADVEIKVRIAIIALKAVSVIRCCIWFSSLLTCICVG